MKELKFRACIDKNTVIYFTLEDLVNPEPLFSIRELVKPWLLAGNKPDEYTGLKDSYAKEEYFGDFIKEADGTIRVIEDGDSAVLYLNRRATDASKYFWDLHGHKVIGNVRNNPELLKETS